MPAFHSSVREPLRPLPSRRRGFALLITITLVAFLVLILVTLASLTRVETTVASNSQQLAMARQNALTALNIALGELQKYAGPDQRATTRADIAATGPANGTRQWTAVWGNANNPQSNTVANLSSAPVLLQWLVSGNEQTAFDPATGLSTTAGSFGQITTPPAAWNYVPATTVNGVDASTTIDSNVTVANDPAVLLVGPATVGSDPGDESGYVVAPLVNIKVPPVSVPGAGTSGSDITVGKYAWWIGDEGVKARANLVDPYVVPTTQMASAGVPAVPASPLRLMSPQRLAVERLPGLGTFPVNDPGTRKLLDATHLNIAASTLPATSAGEHFHDLTTKSFGVLADQRRGGLKRDLTFAFAQTPANFRAALDLPSPTVNPLIPTAIMPASEQGPTWEQLRSFGNLDGSATIFPRPQTATEHGVYPVLAQARIGVGGRIIADGANSRFILRIAPSFVLANPYNAPLAAATYRVRIDFGANSQLSAFTGSTTNGSSSFWRMYLRELLEGQVFEVTNVALGAGEARIFTPAADNTPWAPVQTIAMDNDWSDFAIELDTTAHGGATFDETVPYNYPNPSAPPANLYAKGVHLVFGDGEPSTTASWTNTTGAPGPRLSSTSGGSQRGGVLSWALLDADNTVLQRIESMGYAVNPVSMFGIRGETIQNSGASILMMADAGTFTATRTLPYYSQFNWRAPLVSRTSLYSSRINALGSWNQNFYQGTSASPVLERWILRKQTAPPFTHVEWNGVVGTHLSRPLGQDNWRPFDIPRSPAGLVSLGQLQHFNAAGHYDITYPGPASPLSSRPSSPSAQRARYLSPTYAIGNSRGSPNVASDRVSQDHTSQPYYDVSYLLNRELLDGYFFSTYPQSSPVDLATDRLPNPRLQPFRNEIDTANTEAFRGPAAFAPENARLAARNLLLAGPFNVNSTSVAAWTAVLSSLRQTEFNGETGLEGPFLRSIHQPGGKSGSETGATPDAWNGFRDLTPTQINDLATALVAEIRARGPALSVADFVNRRLTSATPAHTHAGPLQAAIDATDINTAFINTVDNTGGTSINFPAPAASTATLPYDETENLAKHGLEGIAGWLTQADLYQALAPMLTARSDTFRIRTYGETRNPVTNDITGRAWCEAIVQRLPDHVSDADDDRTSPANLTSTDNQRFGRRFVVVDFRWLSPADI